MSEANDFMLKRYELATNRLNVSDQWAQNFVSLYFVVCAALLTAAGFSGGTIGEKSINLFHFQISSRLFSIVGASSVGLLVSVWAMAMVSEWFFRRRRIIRQILEMEKNLRYWGRETTHREWGSPRAVDKIAMFMTAIVLVMTVLGWFLLLIGALAAPTQ